MKLSSPFEENDIHSINKSDMLEGIVKTHIHNRINNIHDDIHGDSN